MTTERISAAMGAVVELSERLGISRVCDLPGCWEVQVDEHWWLACNGHKEPAKCSKGVEVEPFGCYVEFNGWPAGTFDAFGGVMAAEAAGAAANEEAFIKALKEKRA